MTIRLVGAMKCAEIAHVFICGLVLNLNKKSIKIIKLFISNLKKFPPSN